MTLRTQGGEDAAVYDAAEAGPPTECQSCAPGHVTQLRPVFTDDRVGRLAHAKAFGHYPPRTDREDQQS